MSIPKIACDLNDISMAYVNNLQLPTLKLTVCSILRQYPHRKIVEGFREEPKSATCIAVRNDMLVHDRSATNEQRHNKSAEFLTYASMWMPWSGLFVNLHVALLMVIQGSVRMNEIN